MIPRKRQIAQLIFGGLVLLLCVGGSGQQAKQQAKKSSVKKKPTVAEILDWLQNKVNAQNTAQQSAKLTIGDFLIVTSETKITKHEGCLIEVRVTSHSIYEGRDNQPPDDVLKDFDLAAYNPDTRVQKKQIITPVEWQPPAGWEVIAPFGGIGDSFKLNFNEEEVALRASKALHDAIILCGGKETKEIY